MVATRMNNQNDSSTKDENNSEQETPSALQVTGPKAEKHCSRAANEKGALRDPMFWLLFCTFLATSGAAFFTRQQWITADQTMRIANRAYVYSTNFRFIHYGYKPNGTDLQWIVAPLIENTGNTGTHRMMIKIGTVVGPVNFSALEQREFTPAVLLPKSDMTAGEIAVEGPKLNEYMGQLSGIGIIRYSDVFGDPHLEQFCHRAQFSDIDWNGWPAGQPLRIRGVACDDHNCADEHCGPDWRGRATGKKMEPVL
jgi:hypothetical protein